MVKEIQKGSAFHNFHWFTINCPRSGPLIIALLLNNNVRAMEQWNFKELINQRIKSVFQCPLWLKVWQGYRIFSANFVVKKKNLYVVSFCYSSPFIYCDSVWLPIYVLRKERRKRMRDKWMVNKVFVFSGDERGVSLPTGSPLLCHP